MLNYYTDIDNNKHNEDQVLFLQEILKMTYAKSSYQYGEH